MADPNATDHTGHQKSLAFLQDASKVTNYQMPAPNQHVSKNPSDLQDAIDAQAVSTNKDNYADQPDQPLDLTSGPPKKYIDDQPAVPLSNFAAANMPPKANDIDNNNNDNIINNNDNDKIDAFKPATNQQDQQNYDAFFGGGGGGGGGGAADDDNNNINNDNNNDIFQSIDNNNNNNNNITDNNDIFQNIDNKDDNDDDDDDDDDDDNDDADDQSKQTFLSVWQEQRREHLLKKGKEEREKNEADIASGKKTLQEFNEKRRIQVENARKEAKGRENDLRDDYNAVFKHGTIWQQVAKLVDLKTKKDDIERMRNILIVLKNQDDVAKKSDNK